MKRRVIEVKEVIGEVDVGQHGGKRPNNDKMVLLRKGTHVLGWRRRVQNGWNTGGHTTDSEVT